MPAETDLRSLLAGMTPTLRPETYVFCTLPPGESLPPGIAPFATVREDEGLTVVVEAGYAGSLRAPPSAPFRAITLAVCSSLDAVGFVAVIARSLAEAGIAANVISGYHHDHVFVTVDRAQDAMDVLRTITSRA